MPQRSDIESILVIGSGPIVIGQACEFDYSGTQAVRVLRQLGYRVILVNSNPATIMTDPELADATYLEPLSADYVAEIIKKERPDCLLPTMGGQTALNITVELAESGLLEREGVELIGANLDAIQTAEDREKFKSAMVEIGLDVPRSGTVTTVDEARELCVDLGFPVVIRPAFTLGGGGSGTAYDAGELDRIASEGIRRSPVGQVLIEESVHGWKEFELEVMRDLNDNVVIICSIENIDPMGVHTGDSITVAPQQTLTDVEYQEMRDAAIRCIRRIGVETGGSNIQFAVHPETGRQVVIEMNPRVSRSSALASKATGFPIAKMAAQLAVGFTLDEIPNDITKKTPASFEPVIDYVVTKVPRWAFEKFPGAAPRLGTTMHSVGEAMAIGRTFAESFQKALRSTETGNQGFGAGAKEARFRASKDVLLEHAAEATPERILWVESALRSGIGVDEVYAATKIDPWFLREMHTVVTARAELESRGFTGTSTRALRDAKRLGFSDAQLACLWDCDEAEVRARRHAEGVVPVFKTVDTCAAEFEAHTPYHYSTYEDDSEVVVSARPRVAILGAGPNRIGQGIEFDYCCVHAVYALEEAGYETVMINCNPETVSTDYDTASQLFFEPLTHEDVLHVVSAVEPEGVLLQLGGQTPLGLARGLEAAGVPVRGTAPSAIHAAEDREEFNRLCDEIGIRQPPGGTAVTADEAIDVADEIGFPVLVRPSYVLGGRSMEIIYGTEDLASAVAAMQSDGAFGAGRPLLIDRFLEDAVEVDVDCCFDGETFMLGGILEHIEEAGVHSGDSACVIPPPTLSIQVQEQILHATEQLARRLEVRGLLNVQYAVRGEQVYVIEANPRASRTVPFISKAINVPLAKIAARVAMGEKIADLEADGYFRRPDGRPGAWKHISVKEAVLPFTRFPGSDALIGPEMRSTGEVMGIDADFGTAYSKAQLSAGSVLPLKGRVFISIADRDKKEPIADAVRALSESGFEIVATAGTASWLSATGIAVAEEVAKLTSDGSDTEGVPTAVDLIADGRIDVVFNTPRGRGPRADGAYIRTAAVEADIPIVTTIAGAKAAVAAIAAGCDDLRVRSLQDWHGLMSEREPG